MAQLSGQNSQTQVVEKALLFALGFRRVGGSLDARKSQGSTRGIELHREYNLSIVDIDRLGHAATQEATLSTRSIRGSASRKKNRRRHEPAVIVDETEQVRAALAGGHLGIG